MVNDNPFAVAAERASSLGVCPISMLEDFYTNHWDHDSMCSGFTCEECVATPEDFGYEHWWRPGEPDEQSSIRIDDSESFEIDF